MSCLGAAPRDGSVSRSDDAVSADRTFSRASRIRARKQFLELYERGCRMSGEYFVVFGLPGACAGSRLGITATRKFGSAVARNRIKRVVREIFRNSRNAGDPPIDVIVNVRASARGESYGRLEADLAPKLRGLRRRLHT